MSAVRVLFALVMAVPLGAATIYFNDFRDTSSLTMVGSPYTYQPEPGQYVVRLTDTLNQGVWPGDPGNHEAAAVWYSTPVPVAGGFDTTFTFRLTDFGGWPLDHSGPSGRTGADGLTFAIQGVGTSALGISDSGIGYLYIPDSLVVEIDTWSNQPDLYCEPNDAHISVHSMGTLPNRSEHCAVDIGGGEMRSADLGTSVIPLELSDGAIHTARIVYASSVLWASIDGFPLLAVNVDIDRLLDLKNGSAWVGFTASTGGAFENQDLLSWSYTSVPEPGTMALLGVGLLAIGLLQRRRRG